MLGKISGLRKAKVYIYDNRIFIRTPIGESYDLDVIENDLHQEWIPIGWRFWQRRRVYQYGLSFQMDGKEVKVPLDWLKDEHRQQIFSQIAYLHNEASGDFELHFPIEFEVLKEEIADTICFNIIINLILLGFFGGLLSLFIRGGLVNFPAIVRNSVSFAGFAYLTFEPFMDILSFRKVKSRIPSRVEINEMGICFDDEEILYEDMLSVTINGREKDSFYSLKISTETKDYQYPLGIGEIFLLESVSNENENSSFLKIFKQVILENGVEYYKM
ncbi:MAG: hypothetical protein Q4D65_04810 [Peptostreptococcaceae bacterium]|nr:hypothetical protein [Peptostreptococcaceae bacterium]